MTCPRCGCAVDDEGAHDRHHLTLDLALEQLQINTELLETMLDGDSAYVPVETIDTKGRT